MLIILSNNRIIRTRIQNIAQAATVQELLNIVQTATVQELLNIAQTATVQELLNNKVNLPMCESTVNEARHRSTPRNN